MMHRLLQDNNSLKRELAEFMKPVVHLIYNEIYLYIWFICIYSIFLMIVTLANLFVLLRLWQRCGRAEGVEGTCCG